MTYLERLALACLGPVLAAQSLHIDLATPERPIAIGGEGVLHGVAPAGTSLWILRGPELAAHSLLDGARQRAVRAPRGARSLGGWRGKLVCLGERDVRIHDAAGAGEQVVPLPEPWAAGSVTGVGDRLLLVTGRRVFEVDVARASVSPLQGELPSEPRWICGDDRWLWVADDRRLTAFTIGPGGTVVAAAVGPRSWPVDQTVLAGAWVGVRLLVAHQRSDGRKKQLGLTFVCNEWEPLPAERLTVSVSVDGEARKYEVGPCPMATLDDVRAALVRHAANPLHVVVWPRGERRLMPIELRTGPGTVFDDADRIWSIARAAGFLDVTFVAR